MNDKDNIILFPTNRIKNKESAKKPVDEKQHKRLVEEQTKEFVEGNVDDIAYTLLDKFVNMGIVTNKLTFTADLAVVIDTIRGLIYRDFNKPHPAQHLADKMVSINQESESDSEDESSNSESSPEVDVIDNHRFIETDFTPNSISSFVFNLSSTLRKNSQEIKPITIFPNPTSGLIFISGNDTQVKCSVFSMTGKKLFEQKISNENKLDLSLLNVGLYFIQIQQHDKIQNFKVLLTR